MKQFLYILSLLFMATSCSTDSNQTAGVGKGMLALQEVAVMNPNQEAIGRGIDNDLAIQVLKADNTPVAGMSYAAGSEIPSKLNLDAGNYKLYAYTENQTSWRSENNGLGTAVFALTEPFTIEEDWVTYLNLKVPMTNYGVSIQMPNNFNDWFSDYTLTVKEGNRSVPIKGNETAYFDNESLQLVLSAKNVDGEQYELPARTISNLEAGRLYTITYSFGVISEGSISLTLTIDDSFAVIDNEEIIIE